jgi:hypothetical protein
MCLPNFIELKQIEEKNSLVGYKIWKNLIKGSLILKSENQDYEWSKVEGPHEVLGENSGIYSYNSHNYYNYYNNNYYNNYNSYYNNNYHNYYLSGIILLWGKVAIHNTGYRSEFAKIDTLFNIRELDAEGPTEFLNWIKIFNIRIEQIAERYECKIISYQDFNKNRQSHKQ